MVQVKLTLDQASFLWERLHKATAQGTRFRPETIKRDILTFPPALLETIWNRLEDLRSTTPFLEGNRGSIRLLQQSLTLDLRKHEAKYLLRILKNKKRDEWRREKLERERFGPLEAAEIAEEEGGRESFFSPTHAEHPDAMIRQAVIQRALGELPEALGIPADEVTALLAAMTEAEGNVSEAARQLGQPQRKTARRIERILKHLKSRGLSA